MTALPPLDDLGKLGEVHPAFLEFLKETVDREATELREPALRLLERLHAAGIDGRKQLRRLEWQDVEWKRWRTVTTKLVDAWRSRQKHWRTTRDFLVVLQRKHVGWLHMAWTGVLTGIAGATGTGLSDLPPWQMALVVAVTVAVGSSVTWAMRRFTYAFSLRPKLRRHLLAHHGMLAQTLYVLRLRGAEWRELKKALEPTIYELEWWLESADYLGGQG